MPHITRWTAAVAILCVLCPSLQAQQPAGPPATGAISGTLTTTDGAGPIRKAEVKLISASPRLTRTTTTDGDGRFVFANLPAAEYVLSATRVGFLESVYGARVPGAGRPGTPLRLAAGQRINDLSLALPRGGVIAGTVRDEFGDQAYNVPVRALRFAFSGGQRTVQTAGTAVTDDQGAFRIAGLLPGEYLVTAVPRDTVAATAAQAEALAGRVEQIQAAARGGAAGAQAAVAQMDEAIRAGRGPQSPAAKGYVPVYHPGTPMASTAVVVRVGVSEQIFGIDTRLEIVETATVSGTLVNAQGTPMAGNVQLVDPAMPIGSVGVWFGRARPDGRFAFVGVVPGDYVLRGNNSPPGQIGTAPGGAPFQMSGPVRVRAAAGASDNVVVTMQPNVSVSGGVELDTVSPPANRSAIRVRLAPISTSSDWELAAFDATPGVDGRFLLREVPAGRYRIDVTGLPTGWALASAMFGNRDAADHHLVLEPDGDYSRGLLTFTNRTAELIGTLTTAAGAPSPGFTAVVFPADRQLWLPQSRRIRVALTGPDGRYAIRGLPSGEYRIAAVSSLDTGQHFDVEFLSQLLGASTAVTLGAGEQRTQDLRAR